MTLRYRCHCFVLGHRPGRLVAWPEMPEVEALAGFLRERTAGLVIARVDIGNISVLKTYDPPPTALAGLPVTGVARFGKVHPRPRGRRAAPGVPPRAGPAGCAGRTSWRRPPVAAGQEPHRGVALVHLSDGSGFDLTEAGTRKRLAAYIVRDPQEVPGIATARAGARSTRRSTGRRWPRCWPGRRSQVKGVLRDQSLLAGVGNAYSDEISCTRPSSRRTPWPAP